jgi:predicted O-methyltransferase YrrM
VKGIQLISLLPRRPGEFVDRAAAILSSRWESSFGIRAEYRSVGVEEGIGQLLSLLGPKAACALEDEALSEIERCVKQREAELLQTAPFGRFHNGDVLLVRLCYLLARTLRPKSVIETGVCYGVTSSYLLQALEVNAEGNLWSIDLPPLATNGDDYVGRLVPEELRARWTLCRGTSKKLLRPLLAELGYIDLFIHDSLHTYGNMKREFLTAWPALRSGGVLISDDVEGNPAFSDLARKADVAASVVIKEQQKSSLLGIAVKK